MNAPAIIRVLLVEDDREDAILVREILSRADADRFNITRVASLSEAAQLVERQSFDVVFLDLSLPEAPGLSAFSRIQPIAHGMPIVVMARPAEEGQALKAVELGAQDYLIKALGASFSVARIRRAMERTWADERLSYVSRYDPVTNLPNRRKFREALDQSIAAAAKHGRQVGLLFMDLDRFKAVNDSLGHEPADRLLKEVAERLKDCVGNLGMVARLGGDEFTVLLESVADTEAATRLAQRILDAVAKPIFLDGREVFVTTSIGLAFYPMCGSDADTLIRTADTAVFRAKEQGPNTFRVYSPGMNPRAFERMALESSLRRALERDELLLYYQPQVEIQSGRIIGLEALVRWHHPRLGLVPPGQFIWLAEETGLIVPIGEWVLKTACMQSRKLQESGFPALPVGVNLSARQFKQANLVEMVATALNESGIAPEHLVLELTEGLLMDDTPTVNAMLGRLKKMGVKISIDDFGTGYSSMAYLKRFPLDTLKIARTFVKDVPGNGSDRAIANAIIALAHGLGLSAVAEGVETKEQFECLRELGCDAVQGFYCGRPMPSRNVARLLANAEVFTGTPEPLETE